MALGAVLGAALQGSAPRYSLTAAGLDLIPYVPITSVSVSHAVAGGVSTMRFTVEDPTAALTMAEGMMVRYSDTRGERQFYGWIGDLDKRPFGTGRVFEVSCTGIEALLDVRAVLSDMVFATGSVRPMADLIQACWTNSYFPTAGSTPVTPVTVYAHERHEVIATSSGATASTVTGPISVLSSISAGTATLTITANTTLRAAIRQIATAAALGTTRTYATIDPNGALRVWMDGDTLDFGTVAVVDTVGSTLAATNPVLHTFTSIPNTQLSDPVQDGTGTMTLSDVVPPAALAWPGTSITYTAANLGQSAAPYELGQLDKVYQGSGRQTWTLTLGRANQSYVDTT